ncbi:hypothetical protein ANACOL_00488 [Anaerotruncus colihominis DSM 17241]|uniref:Uncharacterized protein n=1 Tax=Anaerotruncus colihominis DSM 17241 TaxID=445972 RepID=B0P6W1_9FIRM|nr:hypothetical protein ANACOL_00488 [Anaerotruncus colihominis DSM 17241]
MILSRLVIFLHILYNKQMIFYCFSYFTLFSCMAQLFFTASHVERGPTRWTT